MRDQFRCDENRWKCLKTMAAAVACLLTVFLGACERKVETRNEPVSRTSCVGRHRLELPDDFQLSLPVALSLSRSFNGGDPIKVEIEVIADQVTSSDIQARMDARIAEIASYSTGETDILKVSDRIGEGAYRIRINKVEDYYASELHILISGTYVKLSSLSRESNVAQVEQALVALASNITHGGEGMKPADSFCAGSVLVDGGNISESSIFTFRGKKRADVLIDVMIDSHARDDRAGLLDRVNGSKTLLRFLSKRPRVIRQGERMLGDMSAQEWLSVAEVDGLTQYIFAIETVGRKRPSPDAPNIHVELRSGQYDSSGRQANSLNDETAVAMWDKIIGSMKSRR